MLQLQTDFYEIGTCGFRRNPPTTFTGLEFRSGQAAAGNDASFDSLLPNASDTTLGMPRLSKDHAQALAEVLAERCDGLLLLTATPHDGFDPHFASLVQLLDPSLLDAATDPES